MTSPIRPAITSSAPAIMSQCGSNSHSMAALTISTCFLAFSPRSTSCRSFPARSCTSSTPRSRVIAISSHETSASKRSRSWRSSSGVQGLSLLLPVFTVVICCRAPESNKLTKVRQSVGASQALGARTCNEKLPPRVLANQASGADRFRGFLKWKARV